MMAVPATKTGVVVTLNVPVNAPAAMVNVAGTVANALSLVKLTTSPPTGAALVKVMVPVTVAVWPISTFGDIDRLAIDGFGSTVSVACLLTPSVPVIVTVVLEETEVVDIGKVDVV